MVPYHFKQLSHEKNPPTFHYTGCLIGILMMVIPIPIYLGSIIPYIKQPTKVFFVAHLPFPFPLPATSDHPQKWEIKARGIHTNKTSAWNSTKGTTKWAQKTSYKWGEITPVKPIYFRPFIGAIPYNL